MMGLAELSKGLIKSARVELGETQVGTLFAIDNGSVIMANANPDDTSDGKNMLRKGDEPMELNL